MDSVFLNGGVIGVTMDYGAVDRYIVGTSSVRGTISYVGGRTQTSNATADITVSLTGLTGGVATAPVQGDIVLVVRTWSSTPDRSFTTSSTGWTKLSDLYISDTASTNFAIFYKIMGVTPDTSIVLNGHVSTAESSAMVVYVFRGVDLTTPFDVTSTTVTQIDTGIPNPPAITPTTTNSIIVVAAGTGHTGGVDTFTAGYLTNFVTVGSDSTQDATTGIGWLTWASGAYDPAAWTFSQTNSTAYSSISVTMALRAALVTTNVFGNLKNSGIWNLPAVYDTIYVPPSQVAFTTPGTTTWTVPSGVRTISAVAVGGGGGGAGSQGGRGEANIGGGGGGLAYGTFTVTPGETLTVVVGAGGAGGASGGANGSGGGISSIARGVTVLLGGGGGNGGQERSNTAAAGGTLSGTGLVGGGAGGASGAGTTASGGSGGGGAGGYSAAGGVGGTSTGGNGVAATGGGGGGGGGRSGTSNLGGSGGGVGILGAGANGTAGTTSAGGGGGSGGSVGATNGVTPSGGGLYGGGGGARTDQLGAGGAGGQGAVRIIWGSGRSYPSTGTGNV